MSRRSRACSVGFDALQGAFSIYYCLWYPVVVALVTLAVGLLFLLETFRRKLSDS